MQATMMDVALSTQLILAHGSRIHAGSRVASFMDGAFQASLFEHVAQRAAALANGLAALGIRRGDRVATLCWNTQPHFEAYLAVPSMGAVLHTVNVRLYADQVAG